MGFALEGVPRGRNPCAPVTGNPGNDALPQHVSEAQRKCKIKKPSKIFGQIKHSMDGFSCD